jgi:hypothetical protein
VRKNIDTIASPDLIQLAPCLPKTRSGKIMRRLRKIADEFGNLGENLDARRACGGQRAPDRHQATWARGRRGGDPRRVTDGEPAIDLSAGAGRYAGMGAVPDQLMARGAVPQ